MDTNSLNDNSLETCQKCSLEIHDKHIYFVNGSPWHGSCIQCSTCNKLLDNRCYSADGKLYCADDFIRMQMVQCSGCGDFIYPSQLVQLLDGLPVHSHCLICDICNRPFNKNDMIVRYASRILCTFDYQQYISKLAENPLMIPSMTSRPTKRPRTILTASQRKRFQEVFECSPKPSRKVREDLAAETGLKPRVVQVWFQNERAKMKKNSKRSIDFNFIEDDQVEENL